MNPATAIDKTSRQQPDLAHFRSRYPQMVARLGMLAEREKWLGRIWELDQRWQQSRESAVPPEVICYEAPPAGLEVEGEFDIIYGGGVLGLLHAGVMASRYGWRVMVFDAHTVGRTHRDWNISDAELQEFVRAKLFTPEELEQAVVNRYRSGFVKFHDTKSQVKTPPLWMDGVLDVAVEADKLLGLATRKVSQQPGCALFDGLTFERVYIEPQRVTVECLDRRGNRRRFTAKLFVDALGTNSVVSRQLNAGQSITHVCPTVGTVARGFTQGRAIEQPDTVDFNVGEILVSTEDARDHRQLIWEGFAGSPQRDEYTTYLFFYDEVNSSADKSLLNLFETYFEKLESYKRTGNQWRVVKPVFGYIPSYHQHGWRGNRKQTATDRVLLVGDAASLSSPLTFCGFGSHVRNLRRLTHLTDLALRGEIFDSETLNQINAYEPQVSQMSSLAEFMRPTAASKPEAVNETMNAVMAALHELDETVRRQMFQDRMTLATLWRMLTATARIYPRIFQRVREHLGWRGTLRWMADITVAARHERRSPPLLLDIGEDDRPSRADAARYLAYFLAKYRSQD